MLELVLILYGNDEIELMFWHEWFLYVILEHDDPFGFNFPLLNAQGWYTMKYETMMQSINENLHSIVCKRKFTIMKDLE